MKYPFLPVLLCYLGGVIVGVWQLLPISWLFAIAFATWAVCLVSARLRGILLGPLLFLAGWTNFTCKTSALSPIDLRHLVGDVIERAKVRGFLVDTPTHRVSWKNGNELWRTLAVVEVEMFNRTGSWERARGRIAVDVPGILDRDFFARRAVEVSGVLSRPPAPAAPGLFSYEAYLRWKGIYYTLHTTSTNDWSLFPSSKPQLRRPWSDRFVDWARKTLRRGLPGEDEPLRLLYAMVLGWRTALTDEVSEPFMKTGTMHIFAISGLHVALVAGILISVLRVFRVPRSVCGLAVIPAVWFYTASTGWQASAIRASIMMTVVLVGWALRRPTNLVNSLAASAFIILVWEPRQLFQTGFQLSFAVVLSMALVAQPLISLVNKIFRTDPLVPTELVAWWKRWLISGVRGLGKAFAVSLSAWLGSLPLIATYFHLVTPISLLANVVMVPLSGAALTCCLGSFICGAWVGWLSELFNWSAWFWMRLMMYLGENAARLPGAFFRVPKLEPTLTAAFYLALLASGIQGANARAWRQKLFGAAVCSLLVFLSGLWCERNEVTVTVIPMNGGHAVVIDGPGRENDLLIDPGDERSAGYIVKPFLEACGYSTFPRMLLTHGDVRHVGGASLIADEFSVPIIFTGHSRSRSPSYRRMLARLEQQPTRWRKVAAGDTISGLQVLHPGKDESFAIADDNAVVLGGLLAGVQLLLLSDLGIEGQRALLERGEFQPGGIVVTGLPSRGEALSDDLLKALQAQLVIVADSEQPSYARASDNFRHRLAKHGIRAVYCSDVGSVTLRLQNGHFRVRTMKLQKTFSHVPQAR